jgi:hypothetical protein
MDLDDLQRKLIAAARARPPGDAVPYAFEKRITARIKALGVADNWALWSRALWRAAAPCIAVTLLLAAWSLLTAPPNSPSTDLSQEFENTVLAAAVLDQPPAESPR